MYSDGWPAFIHASETSCMWLVLNSWTKFLDVTVAA